MANKKKKKTASKIVKTDVSENKAFYTLWNEGSPLPTRVKFTTQEEAVRVGSNMARKTGESFHVMKVVQKIEIPLPPLKVTTYT
jgi:hypothetical protein